MLVLSVAMSSSSRNLDQPPALKLPRLKDSCDVSSTSKKVGNEKRCEGGGGEGRGGGGGGREERGGGIEEREGRDFLEKTDPALSDGNGEAKPPALKEGEIEEREGRDFLEKTDPALSDGNGEANVQYTTESVERSIDKDHTFGCNEVTSSSQQADKESYTSLLPPLNQFSLAKVLFEDPKSKSMAVSGHFSGSTDIAVLVAEKTPLTKSSLVELCSPQTQLTTNFHNDIYRQIELSCGGKSGQLRLMAVYPASEAHVTKYSYQKRFFVHETPEYYASVTKPFIEKQAFDIQWVFNILDGKAEQDRVLFTDSDPTNGFVLVPDFKWDQKEMQNLYILAIVRRRGIFSLRELREEHLPLLKNILTRGQEAISQRYSIPGNQLRTYLHYQPSYYHLHVHFTHLDYVAPKTTIGEAHLLSEVIDNIENIDSLYYQKKTLSFVVKELSGLWEEYKRFL